MWQEYEQIMQLNTALTWSECLSLSTFLKILIKVIIKSIDQIGCVWVYVCVHVKTA